MPNYVQDPNDPKKSTPGPKSGNWFDRGGIVAPHTLTKTPHQVLVAADLSHTAGFFFGTSASFAENHHSASTLGTFVHSSSLYTSMLVGASAGTTINISPLAWSGSAADKDKIVFIYRGGPDGLGRP